jgi:membrane protein YqaA with SNARE-associated domain
MELWGLFSSAFISSTLFPGGSEVLLIYLLNEGKLSSTTLWLVSTAGNTLGGMSSYLLGWIIVQYYPAVTFAQKHHQALSRLNKYGPYSLLLSWLPVVGDPLCLAAGWLRIHWMFALLLIAIGKGVRYAAIVGVIH